MVKYPFLLGILLGLPALLWATHGHWLDRYRSGNGSLCCGRNDCVVVEARLVEERVVYPTPADNSIDPKTR